MKKQKLTASEKGLYKKSQEAKDMDTGTVLATLEIMWKGMLGIFVTILIIMIFVWVMGKLGKK